MVACAVSRPSCSWSSWRPWSPPSPAGSRVPAPSLLVVAGLVVGLLPGVPEVRVTPEVVSLVVLPPLLYAAGEETAVARPAPGVAAGHRAGGRPGAGIGGRGGGRRRRGGAADRRAWRSSSARCWPAPTRWRSRALGRRLSLPPRVQALVQAESLFNDATSLVLFRVAVAVAVAGGAHRRRVARRGEFALLAVGGALVGGAGGRGGRACVRRRTGPGAGDRDRAGHPVRRLRAGRGAARVRR